MNIKDLFHMGHVYRYEGHSPTRYEHEMVRYRYTCIRAWWRRCPAQLFRIQPWPEHTDEPEYVEVEGEHTHPPHLGPAFPFPYKSFSEYKRKTQV